MPSTTRALALIVLAALTLPPRAAAQQVVQNGTLVAPVSGVTSGGGGFSGTLFIQRFELQNSALVAVGPISGVLSDARGTRTLVTQVALPVDTTPSPVLPSGAFAAPNSCDSVHVELDSTTQTVLGAALTLERVPIDIAAAESGTVMVTQPAISATAEETPAASGVGVIVGGPTPGVVTTAGAMPPLGPINGGAAASSASAFGTRVPGVVTPVQPPVATSPIAPPQLGTTLCAVARLGSLAASPAQSVQALNQMLQALR